MESDIKKIFSSSAVNFLFRIFGLGASFLVTILITRLFGLRVFGNYSLAFTLSQGSAMIFALGIPSALVKIVGNHSLNHHEAKKILKKGLLLALGFMAIPLLLFVITREYVATELFEKEGLIDYFLVVAITLPLFIFHELFLYFFIAVKNFFRYHLFMFVVPNVLLFIFLYLFYTLNYAEHYTLIAFTIAIFITVVAEALLIFELKPPKHNSPISTRELIKTASPMMFSGLMMYLLNWTDVIILGIMTDEKQVGIYNVAFKVGNVGLLVIISVSTIMMPRMAELYGQGDIAGLKKLVHTSTRLVSLLSIPITLFFLIFGSFVLSFFNAEAVQGTTALSIVALGVLASALAGNVDQILNMSNNATIFRNITIACFVINLVLNVVLIPVYGINGSAAASLVTNVLINIICIIYIKKKLGFYTW